MSHINRKCLMNWYKKRGLFWRNQNILLMETEDEGSCPECVELHDSEMSWWMLGMFNILRIKHAGTNNWKYELYEVYWNSWLVFVVTSSCLCTQNSLTSSSFCSLYLNISTYDKFKQNSTLCLQLIKSFPRHRSSASQMQEMAEVSRSYKY